MHRGAARLLVVSIHILGYDNQVGLLFQINQGMMSGVRFRLGNELPTPVVPFPHQFGVGHKGPGRGQLFGTVLTPEGILPAAKSGDSAGRGNAGPAQHGNFRMRGDGLPVFFQIHGHSILWAGTDSKILILTQQATDLLLVCKEVLSCATY